MAFCYVLPPSKCLTKSRQCPIYLFICLLSQLINTHPSKGELQYLILVRIFHFLVCRREAHSLPNGRVWTQASLDSNARVPSSEPSVQLQITALLL